MIIITHANSSRGQESQSEGCCMTVCDNTVTTIDTSINYMDSFHCNFGSGRAGFAFVDCRVIIFK